MRPLRGMAVVAEYPTRFDADLAAARLAEAGLDSTVLADPSSHVAPHHVVDRTISLVVREELVEHARSLLELDVPRDEEADELDSLYHLRRFADRPTWVRWATIAVLVAIPGPLVLGAVLIGLDLVAGLFP